MVICSPELNVLISSVNVKILYFLKFLFIDDNCLLLFSNKSLFCDCEYTNPKKVKTMLKK